MPTDAVRLLPVQRVRNVESRRSFRTSATVCVLIGALVLLGACSGARGSDSSSTPAEKARAGEHNHGGDGAFNVALVSESIIADVTVDPARVGPTTIHMEFSPPGGSLQKIDTVSGVLTSIDTGEVIDLSFVMDGTNHFHYETSLPTKGTWSLTLVAGLADGNQVEYRTEMTVTSS